MMRSTIKFAFSISILLLLTFPILAQDLWKVMDTKDVPTAPNDIVPYLDAYNSYSLDFEKLAEKLDKAPTEFKSTRGLKVSFPMPDGSLQEMEVFKSTMMQAGLQAKYPNIQNYKIQSEEAGLSGRIAISTMGFIGALNSPNGRIYIDRYSDNETKYYVSYYTSSYTKDVSLLPACGVSPQDEEDYFAELDKENLYLDTDDIVTRTPEGDVTLRTYRLALACTGEWADQKNLDSVEEGLAIMNESVVRLNEIFEYEIGVRLILVDDNDKLVHLNPTTDPYVNPENSGGFLLGQNTAAIGTLLGLDSWDIGHVYHRACSDVGGIASLGSVCGPGKGNGVTCHYSNNLDVITTRVAAHEIGHQFSAPHTFNHCDGENESTGTGYEPGSGHTIMSYAGGCGEALNVASAPYIYYHGNSIERMTNFTQTGNGDDCATYVETGNTNPIVTLDYTDGFSIPIGTPLILEGSAFDAENDNLTYSWEEFDLGPLAFPATPVGDSPQFVSEVPNETPERYLPALSKVITNNFDKLEVIPEVDKDFTFRLTVRDNNDEAGGSHWQEVQFFSTELAGPFKVEYPSIIGEYQAGSEIEVTWDVANTDAAPVNCQFVSIFLSIDGGLTYPHTLASFVLNDGSQLVNIPDVPTNFARVMVRAADNIFYDISNLNSVITPATEAGFSALAIPGYKEICGPNEEIITINTNQILGFSDAIQLEIIGDIPPGVQLTFLDDNIQAGESTDLVINTENLTESGIYTIEMRGVSGTDTSYLSTTIDLKSSDYSELATVSPAGGESAIGIVPTFTWEADADADSYIFELSDDPAFADGTILVYEDDLLNPSYAHDEPLFKNTVYFWRVTGVNRCGPGFTTPISAFATEALSCREYEENEVPINIPSGAASIVELETVIVTNGQVSEVKVRNLKGTHTYFQDLIVSLVSPAGTEVLLWSKRCLGATSYNVGFDSNSPNEIACPMLNGAIYMPTGDLAAFNGEDLFGTWVLKVEDTKSGDGGKINGYVLDICSNASLSAPILIKNNPLFLAPGSQELINNGRLEVEDSDNDADELIYTLVEVPTKGDLRISGSTLNVGSKFTQDDLNTNRIAYYHDGNSQDPDSDYFTFVVDDSEGGWIDQTVFEINLDQANNTSPASFDYDVTIYPNPTDNMVYVEIQNLDSKSFDLEVIDVLGRSIYSATNNSLDGIQYSMENLANGAYFFKITVNEASKVYKVQLQK